jgi:hypothetical protein
MRKKILKALIILFSVLTISIISGGFYLAYLNDQYNQAQRELIILKKRMFEYNKEVYQTIQPPLGAIEDEYTDSGLSTGQQYGATTSIWYHVEDNTKIQDYYEELLTNKGWEFYFSEVYWIEVLNKYVKGNTCINISTFNNKTSYRVLIFQDYIQQKDLPELPPMWFVNLKEYYHTIVEKCPEE